MNTGAPDLLRRSLERLLAMSERMLASARRQAWDDVIHCEAARRQEIARCFSEPLNGSAVEQLSRAIERLLQGDEEVLRLAAADRAALTEAMRQIKDGRYAVRAYASAG